MARRWLLLGARSASARTLDSPEPLIGALRDRALNLLLRGDLEAGLARRRGTLRRGRRPAGEARARLFAHQRPGTLSSSRVGASEGACADLESSAESSHSREHPTGPST